MPIKQEIPIGSTFERWTVIGEAPNRKGIRYMLCMCVCGTISAVACTQLRRMKSKSCGCLQREIAAELKNSQTHGLSKNQDGTTSRLYVIWCGMKGRCYNINDQVYALYGGRGISVCPEWHEYRNFYDWAIVNGYRNDLTIERGDVNGDYCPSNCSWISKCDQALNRTTSRHVTFMGRTLTISQWSRELGIKSATLYYRLNNRWPVEKMFAGQNMEGVKHAS